MVTQQYVQRIAQGYVEQLGRKIRVEEAILTGSWAKGSFLEDSDVHLVIVSDDFSRMSLPERLSFTPIMVFPSGEISNFDTGRKR